MRIILLFLVTSILITTNLYSEKNSPKLKVGVIVPLTGGVSAWGKSVRQGIELANIKYKSQTELFFEDEGICETKKSLSAYKQLLLINKVDIIISSCLEGAGAVAPLARKDGIPFFISGRSSLEFQKRNPNTLTFIALLDSEGEAISQLINKKKWKKGSIITWADYFGVQFKASIINAVKKNKNDFSYNSIEVQQGSNPVGAEVQRILRNNPQVIFLMLSEPVAAYTVKLLKAYRYNGDIVLQSSMLQTDDPKVRKDFSGAIQQKFIFNQDFFNSLRQKIKSKLGDEVVDDFVFSYDGFSVLLKESFKCYDLNKAFNKECIIKNVRNGKLRQGASGEFSYMKDGSTVRPMVFKVVTKKSYKDLEF